MADLPSTLFSGGTWVDTLSVLWRLGRLVMLTHADTQSCASGNTTVLNPSTAILVLLVVVVLYQEAPNGGCQVQSTDVCQTCSSATTFSHKLKFQTLHHGETRLVA